MKFTLPLAALALAAAGAQANPVDMGARLAASGALTAAPSLVTFSVRGGLSAFRNITVTDTGAGYATNLNVTLTHTSGSLGYLDIIGDTCTGATLAPNGTCTLRVEFDGTCPSAETSTWRIDITSTNAPSISIPVTGNSLPGICR